MKRYLIELGEYCKKFSKDWETYCLVSDSYLAGYHSRGVNSNDEIPTEPAKDGQHQLTPRTFIKWKKDNYNLPLAEALKIYLPMYKFKEVRIVEDKNGVISFQGIGERVKLNEDFKFNDVS